MIKLKYSILGFLLFVGLPGCSRPPQFHAPDLIAFYQKADLSTEQVYIRLAEKNQLNHEVSLFIKCSDCSPASLDSLTALKVTLGTVNENIITARLPASAIPAVAECSFVTSIEGAKPGKLK
jgi:hypothetical protein